MAPEQAVGGTVDRRADIWAVGAILYHLLVGQAAVRRRERRPGAHGADERTAARAAPATVHPSVAAVVKRALTATVENRFPTAADMQVAIEDAMDAAKIATNPAAISMFLAEHVAERAKRRKEAIAIGVKAAAERERYAEIMRSNVKVTAGISGTVANAGFNDAAVGSGSRSGLGSSPGVGSRSGRRDQTRARPRDDPASRGGGSSPGPGSGPGNSVVTGGTLGSAAMDVGDGKPSRGRTVAVASIGAGGCSASGGWCCCSRGRRPSMSTQWWSRRRPRGLGRRRAGRRRDRDDALDRRHGHARHAGSDADRTADANAATQRERRSRPRRRCARARPGDHERGAIGRAAHRTRSHFHDPDAREDGSHHEDEG